jgi:HAD superfamily hydrolase (TIGR01509 family)
VRRETPLIRAVLFDLDGLMVDSESHSLASWRAVLSSRGVSLDRAVSERMFGLRQSEAARLLAEVYGLTDRPSALAREKEEYQIRHLDGRIAPMPGLYEFLDEVERRGLRTAVASSGVRPYVGAVLQAVGLAGRFRAVVTGDDVVNGKPAPDVFLAAARAVRTRPHSCLVLEDAPSGVQAAKAAGMRCVAVPNPYTRALDLSAADAILPSLSAVHAALADLTAG